MCMYVYVCIYIYIYIYIRTTVKLATEQSGSLANSLEVGAGSKVYPSINRAVN